MGMGQYQNVLYFLCFSVKLCPYSVLPCETMNYLVTQSYTGYAQGYTDDF